VQTKKMTPEAILRPVPTLCSAISAQTSQLPRSHVQPTQPEKQSIAQKLTKFVNRAQCLARTRHKKATRKTAQNKNG
jgi:hypothetical protein